MFNSPWGIALFVLCVLVGAVLFFVFSTAIVAHILYTMHLKRTSRKKWTRECSSDEPEQLQMYAEGKQWSEKRLDRMRRVHIQNDGLNLYGEYYDFGSKRAVIIVSGRTEGLCYGYYFAEPYEKCGYNVLVIDQRAHGESDGKYNTLGFEEHRDLLAWARFLHSDFGVESILLHGICIGASCCLFALVSEDCPEYMDGMVAEGMYPAFRESFKNHMIELKKPVFPCLDFVNMWMRVYTGHSMNRGPMHVIDGLRKPILMLHSHEDIYSLPQKAEELFVRCGAKEKRLVWFDRGAHSMLRITDTERYDSAVAEFAEKAEAFVSA